MWSVRLIKFSSLVALVLTIAACGGDEAGSDTDGGNNPPANIAPIANAGEDQTVNEQTTVTLSGSGTDADGSIASYSWSQISGSVVVFDDTNTPSLSFTAPELSSQEILEFELTVTDNDGASSTDIVSITVLPTIAQLSNILIMYSDTPIQNQSMNISLVTDEDVGEVNWIVVTQPDSANVSLNKSTDNKTVTLTPSQLGEYKIAARSVSNGSEKTASFFIGPAFPYDETKIEGNDDSVNLDELIGVIRNQFWIYSTSLTEAQLRNIVVGDTTFTVVGYDSTEGLLIEYEDLDDATLESLELLKLKEEVISVLNRVYEGDSVPRDEVITPNDKSDFNDLGDNWHLEAIGATTAWEYTIGNPNIVIGVSDSGFDISHDELQGRITKFDPDIDIQTEKSKAHGNGVAGAIGARTNNRVGISGINWFSQMILALNGAMNLRSILGKDKVVAVNNSWAITGYIPTSFDSSNSLSVIARLVKSFLFSRSYRKLAISNPEKLLIWSAGNGIGNGKGNSNGDFGVDGRLHSPALHYNILGNFQEQSNVIFVAAIRNDNRLAYYSNFGKSVDLAAPTGYKSLKINNGYFEDNSYGENTSPEGIDGIFGGTSAAAPVVTGVASLIYSLFPDFTGEEVKNILIDSADKLIDSEGNCIMERYKAPGDAQNGANIELLEHCIPILNAGKALELATGIIDSKVIVSHTIPDPFSPIVAINFKPLDENFEFKGADVEFSYSIDNGAKWEYISGQSIVERIANFTLPTDKYLFRISANVIWNNLSDGANVTTQKNYTFSIPATMVVIKDTVSNLPLSNVEISIEKIDGVIYSDKGMSDADGSIRAYLEAGSYKVRGILNGYQDTVTFATVSEAQNNLIVLNMTEESAGEIGALSGRVFDEIGSPITNALVRISGGAQTDGFFASVTTDANGNYNLNNISKIDEDGESISSFVLEVVASGYETIVRESVIVLPGNTRAEHFILREQFPEIPEPPSKYLVFTEGNPGVEDDGHYINASTTDNIVEYSLTAERKPLIGTLENGVIITVVTELPTDQAFAQVYFEFGYLDSECLYVADDNNNETDARNNFEAAYYSPRGLEVITESARARSGCENINVSNMFLNRIEFLNFELTNISVDAVIVERGPIIQEPPPSIYGSLTITNDDQADRTWEPTSGIGIPSARSLTGQWFGDGGSYLQLSLPINPDIDVLATITFRTDFSFTTLWCLDADGVIGASVCSGVTTDPLKKTVTFSNVQMAEPPFGENVFTLNGTLRY